MEGVREGRWREGRGAVVTLLIYFHYGLDHILKTITVHQLQAQIRLDGISPVFVAASA